MPRKPLQRSNEHYYHITARSNNREHFYLNTSSVWTITSRHLVELQLEYDLSILAFVLMDNHFHLIVRTPNEDIDRIMYFFMKRVTLEMQKASGRINKIFGGRYKGSLIESHGYLLNVYKYVLRNPVAAGLAIRAEEYPFSSYYDGSYPRFRTDTVEGMNIFLGVKARAERDWINESFDILEIKSIGKGLKKTVFEYQTDRATGRLVAPKFIK